MIDFKLITLGAATFSSLSAMLILIFDLVNGDTFNLKLKSKLVLYFSSHIISEFCFFAYFYYPQTFILVNWVLMLSYTLIPIFLYSFIFKITCVSPDEKFSKYHYLAPVLLSLTMLILSIYTPREEQLAIIMGDGLHKSQSVIFTIFSNKLLIRLIFSVIYVFLCFRRLPLYRKYIKEYTANEQKSSLRWVSTFLFIIACLIPIPLFGIFLSRSGLASSFGTLIYILIFIFQNSYLTFHVIKGYYIIQQTDVQTQEHTKEQEKNTVLQTKETFNKKEFEVFMRTRKPFLDANLKITDLVEHFGINRTYLSSFINSEYGMNFSSYINNLRLTEFNILRSSSQYSNFSNIELAEKAGFGSYRSFNRFNSAQKNSNKTKDY